MLRIHRSRNTIKQIAKENEEIITDREEIANHLVSYFIGKFKENYNQSNQEILEAIPRRITSQDDENLMKIPMMEEISRTLDMIKSDSSPGPDGFTACFFKKWRV